MNRRRSTSGRRRCDATRRATGEQVIKKRKRVPLRSDIAWSAPDRIGSCREKDGAGLRTRFADQCHRSDLLRRAAVASIRGLGVMARAVGLVGHILEESRKPNGAGNLASHGCERERPYAWQVTAAKLTRHRRRPSGPGQRQHINDASTIDRWQASRRRPAP